MADDKVWSSGREAKWNSGFPVEIVIGFLENPGFRKFTVTLGALLLVPPSTIVIFFEIIA